MISDGKHQRLRIKLDFTVYADGHDVADSDSPDGINAVMSLLANLTLHRAERRIEAVGLTGGWEEGRWSFSVVRPKKSVELGTSKKKRRRKKDEQKKAT